MTQLDFPPSYLNAKLDVEHLSDMGFDDIPLSLLVVFYAEVEKLMMADASTRLVLTWTWSSSSRTTTTTTARGQKILEDAWDARERKHKRSRPSGDQGLHG